MIITQAETLERIPASVRGDFDCPDRGPHDFLEITAAGMTYRFCRHCRGYKKRTVTWDDMRDLYRYPSST